MSSPKKQKLDWESTLASHMERLAAAVPATPTFLHFAERRYLFDAEEVTFFRVSDREWSTSPLTFGSRLERLAGLEAHCEPPVPGEAEWCPEWKDDTQLHAEFGPEDVFRVCVIGALYHLHKDPGHDFRIPDEVVPTVVPTTVDEEVVAARLVFPCD